MNISGYLIASCVCTVISVILITCDTVKRKHKERKLTGIDHLILPATIVLCISVIDLHPGMYTAQLLFICLLYIIKAVKEIDNETIKSKLRIISALPMVISLLLSVIAGEHARKELDALQKQKEIMVQNASVLNQNVASDTVDEFNAAVHEAYDAIPEFDKKIFIEDDILEQLLITTDIRKEAC